MTIEKRKRSGTINILAFIILAGVTLAAYFMPLNGNNVLTLELKYPNLISGPAFTWYFYFIALLGLAFFTIFQARKMEYRDNISAKTTDTLGWLPAGLALVYSLATVFLHFEHFGLTITCLVLSAIILMVANGNIRDNEAVMAEKFWVRNPFSFFFGWVLYLLMSTIAMGWHQTFAQESPALILFVLFLAFVLYFAFANNNIGVPISWILILLLKQLQPPPSQMLMTLVWVGIGLLLIIIFQIVRKDHQQHSFRKPVSRAMDKFNFGEESKLKKLEEELNEELKTKPGARINLRS